MQNWTATKFPSHSILMMQMGLPESVGKRCSGLLFFSWGVMANGIAVSVAFPFVSSADHRDLFEFKLHQVHSGSSWQMGDQAQSIEISTITVIFPN